MKTIVKINNISKSFLESLSFNIFKRSSKKQILSETSFNIYDQDFICLTGSNGSGKTSLLKIIARILRPDAGKVEGDYNPSLATGNDRSFFWRLSVKENLKFFENIAANRNHKVPYEKIEMLHNILQTEELLELPFMSLSSGQKKKIIILRSIITNPDIILFDEVTNSLDNETSELLVKFTYKELAQELGIPVMWATHNENELKDIRCRNLHIDAKKIIEKNA